MACHWPELDIHDYTRALNEFLTWNNWLNTLHKHFLWGRWSHLIASSSQSFKPCDIYYCGCKKGKELAWILILDSEISNALICLLLFHFQTQKCTRELQLKAWRFLQGGNKSAPNHEGGREWPHVCGSLAQSEGDRLAGRPGLVPSSWMEAPLAEALLVGPHLVRSLASPKHLAHALPTPAVHDSLGAHCPPQLAPTGHSVEIFEGRGCHPFRALIDHVQQAALWKSIRGLIFIDQS